MAEQVLDAVLALVAEENAGGAIKLIGSLDTHLEQSSLTLEAIWHSLGSPQAAGSKDDLASVREAARAALQACDVQLGRHMGGSARCPHCLSMCQWHEAELCGHFVGVEVSEEGEQLLLPEDWGLVERWSDAVAVVENGECVPLEEASESELPGEVADAANKGASAGLRDLMESCGVAFIDTDASSGERMAMCFAESPARLRDELESSIVDLETWVLSEPEEEEDEDEEDDAEEDEEDQEDGDEEDEDEDADEAEEAGEGSERPS
jgi:hypothetical protein